MEDNEKRKGKTTKESTSKYIDPAKQLLQCLYNNKSERFSLRPNHKGKNKRLWRQFQLAYLDDLEQPYAMCLECRNIVRYCGRTGTGGLVRHHCFSRAYSMGRKQTQPKTGRPSSPKTSFPTPGRLEVEDLVLQNSPRVGFVPNYRGKSEVWEQFEIITLDNEAVNLAACKLCRSIVTYISRTGTGSMTRHKCQKARRMLISNDEDEPENLSVKQEPKDEPDSSHPSPSASPSPEMTGMQLTAFSDLLQANLQGFRTKSGSPSPPPPPRQTPEDLVRHQYQDLLRRSLGVFNTLCNDDFFNLAQTLVNIGAEYGKIDIQRVLADASHRDSTFDTHS